MRGDRLGGRRVGLRALPARQLGGGVRRLGVGGGRPVLRVGLVLGHVTTFSRASAISLELACELAESHSPSVSASGTSGSRTRNVAPPPGVSATSTVPWCALTSAATMARPSPVPVLPPARRVRAASAR